MRSDAASGAAVLNEGNLRGTSLNLAMILFLALQCLDLLTTLAVFAHGGTELNPVVRSLMPWTGKALAVLVSKLMLVGIISFFIRRKQILWFANIFYSGVVAWNLMILFALK